MKSKSTLKMDLHLHTTFSRRDGRIKPSELIQLAKEKDLNVLGITDHGTTRGAKEVCRLAKKHAPDLIIFIGQEVKTNQGEIIVLGLDFDIKQKQDILKTCTIAKKHGGFIILPHPYDFTRKHFGRHMKDIIKHIDAVEIFNSRCIFNYSNKKAMEFARKNNLPMLAGSDAHLKEEVGNSITLVKANKNKKDILKAIKARKIRTITKKTTLKTRAKAAVLSLMRRI